MKNSSSPVTSFAIFKKIRKLQYLFGIYRFQNNSKILVYKLRCGYTYSSITDVPKHTSYI